MKPPVFFMTLIVGVCFLSIVPVGAQAPSGYYDDAAGLTGEALRAALHEIIADHDAQPYSAAREGVCLLDEDPDNPDNVLLIYSRLSVPETTWPGFNREHLWPQSYGARRHPARSDMHHIFAVNARVNSSRNNKWFDDTEGDPRHHDLAPLSSYDSDSWQVPDAVKGDVARALLYMDVRYEGDDNEPDLVLIDDLPQTGCNCMGRLSTLLSWHLDDPVDERERHRNDRIYTEIQHNRNPFIDHPEWVARIWDMPVITVADVQATTADQIDICSFNIQFLGNSRDRDNAALASMLQDFDIVVVQELVAPPYEGMFPDGSLFRPDTEAALFFQEMEDLGFAYILSEEDTGRGERNHYNNSATEWWVTFYDPDVVEEAHDLPRGFLAEDRTHHPDYARVPYAFAFQAVSGGLDFVLISVHLTPGRYKSAERLGELSAIHSWIAGQEGPERDYIILGDMNIEDADELAVVMPATFSSMNGMCLATNTNVNGPRPYDHVMYDPGHTVEIDQQHGMQVIDLIEAMRPHWNDDDPYPGGGTYDHNRFRRYYSDHHPVEFRMWVHEDDDD
jgi:endonuclease I